MHVDSQYLARLATLVEQLSDYAVPIAGAKVCKDDRLSAETLRHLQGLLASRVSMEVQPGPIARAAAAIQAMVQAAAVYKGEGELCERPDWRCAVELGLDPERGLDRLIDEVSLFLLYVLYAELSHMGRQLATLARECGAAPTT